MVAATTEIHEPHPDDAAEAVRLRAEWLDALAGDERAALAGMPLRAVDALFEAWLDERTGVGDDGGG